jgi:hypothetical protein
MQRNSAAVRFSLDTFFARIYTFVSCNAEYCGVEQARQGE